MKRWGSSARLLLALALGLPGASAGAQAPAVKAPAPAPAKPARKLPARKRAVPPAPAVAQAVPAAPALEAPPVPAQRFDLSTGLRCVLVESHERPLIRMELVARWDRSELPAGKEAG